MKYLTFLSMLVSLVCYADNHKHDHNHNHKHDHKKDKKNSLKAHEHGVGLLNIAQDSNLLVFEFELPGFDVVGFEYKAKKKEDIKKVKQAINVMSKYDNMIEISQKAGCKENQSEAFLLEEGNHTEFRSKYILNCFNINNIEEIEIHYFKNFKNSKKLKVKIVSEKETSTLELLSNDNVIKTKNYF